MLEFNVLLVSLCWFIDLMDFQTLQADLRLADLRARRRAMEDLYAALQAVRNVHSALVSTLRIRSVSKLSASHDLSASKYEHGTNYICYIYLSEIE